MNKAREGDRDGARHGMVYGFGHGTAGHGARYHILCKTRAKPKLEPHARPRLDLNPLSSPMPIA